MKGKNKYIYRSRLSEAKFREIVKCFSLDIEAKKAAVLASLNRNTLNRHYLLIRKCIFDFCEKEEWRLGVVGNANLNFDNADADADDDCYLVKNDSMVFGICLINGNIYTEIIRENDLPDDRKILSSQQELEDYIQSCNSTRYKEYQAVVDYDNGCYMRINVGAGVCAQVDDIKKCDLFWGFAKSRLMKFNGISKMTLHLHVKECEFRFNHRNENLYKLLLKIIRENPLN